MKNYFFYLLTIFLCISCASNPKSFKKDKERVEIKPIQTAAGFAGISLSGAAAIVVPKVIDWSFGKVETFLEKRSKEYVAKYSGSFSDDKFYKKSGTDYKLNNPVIEINRFHSTNKLASSIQLAFEDNLDKSLLRVKPLKIKIDESKARLKKKDNDLDLKIDLKIKAYWKAGKEGIQTKTVAEVSFEVKSINLGKTYTLVKINNHEYVSDNGNVSINKNIKTDWFAPVPISIDDSGNFISNSFGNYSVEVEVTEIDDYGDKVMQFGKDIESSKSVLSELVKEIFKEE